MTGPRDDLSFIGFSRPTTTPVPDEVFDILAPELTGAELKVLLYIIRRTLGFRKDRDKISFSQFLRGITTHDGQVLDRGCGVRDRTTLSKSLAHLEKLGVISAQKVKDERGENDTSIYWLRFEGDSLPSEVVGKSYHRSGENPLEVVGKPDYSSGQNPSEVVGKPYPQQTVQQTVQQQRNPPTPQGGQTSTRTKRRRVADESNPDRYSQGHYGVCPLCNMSPHDPECPGRAEEEQEARHG